MTVSLAGTPLENTPFEERLHRLQRQRDHALRGYERKGMSPQLAEALRAEIRAALDADGKPFDVNVARRVYDLAIAARDMCVAATSGVKEAIDQIKDTNGPIESLDQPDTPTSQLQASETFGARLIREVLATLPRLQRNNGSNEDPKALVHALAEARRNGMHDVAEELEIKLFGRVLSNESRPIAAAIDVVQPVQVIGEPPSTEGTAARFLNPNDPPLCEACKADPDPRGGSACAACREIAQKLAVDTLEGAMRPHASNCLARSFGEDRECNCHRTRRLVDDGNVPRYDDTEQRGRPSNRVPMDPVEREELEGK